MIFPKEILHNTIHPFLYKNKVSSKAIYAITCIGLLGGFSLLPLIKTDIFFTSRGVFRSLSEPKPIVAPSSGIVVYSNIGYNLTVSKGDTLLMLDNREITSQLMDRKITAEIVNEFLADLNYLLFSPQPETNFLKSSLFKASLIKHNQEKKRLEIKINAQEKILERQESLFKNKVITAVEIESARIALENLQEDLNFLVENQKYEWYARRESEKLKRQELQHDISNLQRSTQQYVLVAEETGLLKNVKEILPGTFLRSGEQLCELSPNSTLIAELLVPPSKVGLLLEDNNIKYQIDAFNYRNWGMGTGKIIDISKDIEIINNQPVFKVLASLDQDGLYLQNGTFGEFKRGLTLSGRFQITERSLFDLLYDKADDWVNPGQQDIIRSSTLSKNVN